MVFSISAHSAQPAESAQPAKSAQPAQPAQLAGGHSKIKVITNMTTLIEIDQLVEKLVSCKVKVRLGEEEEEEEWREKRGF